MSCDYLHHFIDVRYAILMQPHCLLYAEGVPNLAMLETVDTEKVCHSTPVIARLPFLEDRLMSCTPRPIGERAVIFQRCPSSRNSLAVACKTYIQADIIT